MIIGIFNVQISQKNSIWHQRDVNVTLMVHPGILLISAFSNQETKPDTNWLAWVHGKSMPLWEPAGGWGREGGQEEWKKKKSGDYRVSKVKESMLLSYFFSCFHFLIFLRIKHEIFIHCILLAPTDIKWWKLCNIKGELTESPPPHFFL